MSYLTKIDVIALLVLTFALIALGFYAVTRDQPSSCTETREAASSQTGPDDNRVTTLTESKTRDCQ